MSSGLYPKDSAEVNMQAGSLLRQYVNTKDMISRYQAWMAATDLKSAPYTHIAGDETNLKTAIAGLNTALQAIDQTFINRCTGLF